ncbi:hypothetical protein D3C81_2225440 [compost metagenome]
MSLSLQAGGQHIVISAGGIFSSVPIVQGGAPMPGVAPLQALTAEARAMIATPVSLLATTKQQATDFCPLCEACRNGQCSLGAVA